MKSILICSLALASSMFISNCISVTPKEQYPSTTTTTTTEKTSSLYPDTNTVETQTTRTR